METIVVVVMNRRLSSSEIRDVFKLGAAYSELPDIILRRGFRRLRWSALLGRGRTGREYLEKILQVAVDFQPFPPTCSIGRSSPP